MYHATHDGNTSVTRSQSTASATQRLTLAAGAAAVTLVAVLGILGLFDRWELTVRDAYCRATAGFFRPDERIALVAVDQAGLDYFVSQGLPWPWPRDLWARLVELAGDAGARGIILDVLYDEPGLDLLNSDGLVSDMVFARELAGGTPTVISALLVADGSYPDSLPPGMRWTGAALRAGGFEHSAIRMPHRRFQGAPIALSNVTPDPDGVIRAVPLLYESRAGAIPALGPQLLERIGEDLRETPPLDRQGRLQLRYYGPGGPRGAFPYIAASQLIRGAVPPDSLQGRLLIVGGYAAGLLDYKATPVAESNLPYPGFEIHATMLSNLLKGDWLRTPARWQELSLTLLWGLAGVLLMRSFRALWLPFALLAGLAGVVLAGGLGAYAAGYQLPVVGSLSACFAGAGARFLTGWQLEGRRRAELHRLFSRYLDTSVIDELLVRRGGLEVGGEERRVTVLFADMVGYTSATEGLNPVETVGMLNAYYKEFVDVILARRGLLDKYIGDAVMVLFGAPVSGPDTDRQAALAVLELQERLERLSAERARRGLATVALRLGVHTDRVVVGNIGHPRRMDYTAIGTGVNIASRLESANRHLQTRNLASGTFCEGLAPEILRREIGRVVLKGLHRPLEVFELLPSGCDTNMLAEWKGAWENWRGGRRRQALEVWRALSPAYPGDEAPGTLASRLEIHREGEGEADDVLVLESK